MTIKSKTILTKYEINNTHYVYRITNTKSNKHYYGSRCSKRKYGTSLQYDLERYKSSSTDKQFKSDMNNNPSNYKFKIIKIFIDNRLYTQKIKKPKFKNMLFSIIKNTNILLYNSINKNILDCIDLEIYMHNKFNVSSNDKFYNRYNQTNGSFNAVGNTTSKSQVTVRDKNMNTFNVSVLDERYLSGELIHISVGSKRTNEEKSRMSGIQKHIHMVNVKDKEGNKYRVKRDDVDYISGKLIHMNVGNVAHNRGVPATEESKKNQSIKMKGRKSHIINKKVLYNISKDMNEYFDKAEYEIAKLLPIYSNPRNNTGRNIAIYDKNLELIIEGYGCLKGWAKDNNISISGCAKSYNNNSKYCGYIFIDKNSSLYSKYNIYELDIIYDLNTLKDVSINKSSTSYIIYNHDKSKSYYFERLSLLSISKFLNIPHNKLHLALKNNHSLYVGVESIDIPLKFRHLKGWSIVYV